MKLGFHYIAQPPSAKEVRYVEPNESYSTAEVAMTRAIEHSHWGVALRRVCQPNGPARSRYIGTDELRSQIVLCARRHLLQQCKQRGTASNAEVVAGLREVFCLTAALLFYEYYMTSPAFEGKGVLPSQLEVFSVQAKTFADRARPPSCRPAEAVWDNVVAEMAYRMFLWELFEQCCDGLQKNRNNAPVWINDQFELQCMHARYIGAIQESSATPKVEFCQHFRNGLFDGDLKRTLIDRIEQLVTSMLDVSGLQARENVTIVSEQFRTNQFVYRYQREINRRREIPFAEPTVKGFAPLLGDLVNLRRASMALRTRCERGWVHLMLSKVLFLRGLGNWEPDGERTLEQDVNELGDAVRELGTVQLRADIRFDADEGGALARSPIGRYLAEDIASALEAWSSMGAPFKEREAEIKTILRGVLVNPMRNRESVVPSVEAAKSTSWLWRLVFSDPRLWSQVAKPLLETNGCDYELIYLERVQP